MEESKTEFRLGMNEEQIAKMWDVLDGIRKDMSVIRESQARIEARPVCNNPALCGAHEKSLEEHAARLAVLERWQSGIVFAGTALWAVVGLALGWLGVLKHFEGK